MLLVRKQYKISLNVLVLIILFLNLPIPAQNKNTTPTNFPELKFEHLNIEHGLSQSVVFSIVQDRKGFLWFGTRSGLNKYDGYKFKIYKNDPNDSLSLGNNWITALYEDHLGELWIGTYQGGLCRYDRNRDSFIRYVYDKENPNSLCSNEITSIIESEEINQHILWIGTESGLNKYNRESDNFTHYFPDENKENIKINVNFIGSITQDYSGKVWIGTWNKGLFYFDAERDKFIKYEPDPKYSEIFINKFVKKIHASQWDEKNILWMESYQNGLYKIELENGKITHYKHQPDNPARLSDNYVFTIYQTDEYSTELWIGTFKGGLNRFDIQTEEFTHYQHQPGNQWSLKNNYVLSIFKDKSGLMWVGTTQGVDKFETKTSKFQTIQQSIAKADGLSGYIVTAILESNEGGDRTILWIGTNDGLNRFDHKSSLFTSYKHDPKNINSISNNWVTKIIESRSGKSRVLWVSTNRGLNKIELKTNRIKRYYILEDDQIHNKMYDLGEDKNGIIWISTQSGYLYSFDPNTEQFTRYRSHDGSPITFHTDLSGLLWIGTDTGLYKFNTATKEETQYRHIEGNLKSISNNFIRSIFEDRGGILWIGTAGGLNKFDRSTETFTSFIEKDGLSNNEVKGILEDDKGNLWLSTENGISKFNPNSETFRNFDATDGLHGDEFSLASYMNLKGEMFFGGKNGLTYFHPDSIKDNTYIPPVVLTDFQIFNKSIKPGNNSPIKKQVSEVSEITLSYDQSIFSIEFAALDYHNPVKNKYAYKMEGVDPDWVYTDASRRFATYTQLDPGEYTFRVNASNNDGIWNEIGTSITITILPPWWATTFAYIVYAILFVISIYAIREYEIRRIRLKHDLEIKAQEAEKLEYINTEKSRFFAGISHEFRTPLTLILGPVERLIKSIKDKLQADDLKRIKDNANRMNKLVDMYLDLSMLESGALSIQKNNEDIIPILKTLIASFESLAEDKKIIFQFIHNFKSVICAIDKEKFEQIFINLVNNAIKFTPMNGKIIVDLEADNSKKQVSISISDTGIGIANDHIDKIFEMFYQVDNDVNKRLSGTGIGLAMVKELVKLHNAEITVQSELGQGTEFSILFSTKEVSDGKTKKKSSDLSEPDGKTELADTGESEIDERIKILVVEDNHEMRAYIKSLLDDQFRIETCRDGIEGVELAIYYLPDLIISDIMMPNMDGYEFIDKIKNDLRTSHVPVILLTAKTKQPDMLKGLKTGADAYIKKPFDTDELLICVENLLENRKRIHKKFRQDRFFDPSEIDITSADEKFLLQCHQAVEDNLSNPDFNMENFADEVHLSRTQLHKKLKVLTGQSATEYVKTLRLKKAAILLESGFGNVTEIAYETGFSNPSYFAECFKKLYNTSPIKYAQSFKS